MLGKLFSCAFLFVFNFIIFIAMDWGFCLLVGDYIVPKGYEWAYAVAAAITVFYQIKANEAKKQPLIVKGG